MWRCGKETRCDPTREPQGSSGNAGFGWRLGEWEQACITDSCHAAAGRLEPLLTVQSETSLMIDSVTDTMSPLPPTPVATAWTADGLMDTDKMLTQGKL